MDYLARDDAPFALEFWQALDSSVVEAASGILVGRRFLPLSGPLGGGAQFATIEGATKSEELAEGFVKSSGRTVVEIPQLYSDFWLYWRDVEASAGSVPDLAAAMQAAQQLARFEDKMIFYGIPALGLEGLLTAKNTAKLKRGDWSKGEGAFSDVAAGLTKLSKSNCLDKYTLVLSFDLYLQLQRIQPGTGLLEIERIKSLLGGRVFKSAVLKEGAALLLCAQPYCMDLLLGQDMMTGYLEMMDFNHHFRIMETALLRLKRPEGVVVYN